MSKNHKEIDAAIEKAYKESNGLFVAVDNSSVQAHNDSVIFEIERQIRAGVQVELYQAYNMLTIENLTIGNRKKLAEVFGMTAPELKTAFNSIKRNASITEELGGVPDNEYEFVNLLLKKWDTEMTFQKMYTITTPYEFEGTTYSEVAIEGLDDETKTFIRSADPKTINFKSMMEKVIKANATIGLDYKEFKVIRAIEDWTYIKQNEIIASVKCKVIFDKKKVAPAEAEWDKFVTAITNKNIPETKSVLKHFIWQIKRKMFNKSVDDHMMPVLNGLQGIGKSTIVKELVSPIKDFVILTNFKDITDGRNHDMWKNYVLILDEMGNSTQSNIEEIKQKITADTINSRIMRTNSDNNIVNSATMIGTTNKDLTTLIFDDTGMRRFYQVSCLPKFDWNVTSNIDFLLLWQSIDENSPTLLSLDEVMKDSIREIQNESRYVGIVENFFRDRKYEGGKAGETIFSLDLYEEFRDYEKVHDPKNMMSSTKFLRDIINIPSKIPNLVIEKSSRRNNKTRVFIAKTGDFE